MASPILGSGVVNREISFCRVYSKEAKDKLEKIFLKNRISYFVEWQERSFLSRLFGTREKNVFTIRINDADIERATELVQGMENVKLRKQDTARSEN
ncbi:MAG: hypothetical protein K6F53_08185 [Lachnospiraceae bacterium]|nr:hypothetical protein [Lachnospiraceae bacterium]